MKKKLLSLLLAATMLVAAFPLFGLSSLAVDAEAYNYDKLYVSYGLQTLFTAYDLEAGDALNTLEDAEGNTYTLTGDNASAVTGGIYLGPDTTLSANDILPDVGSTETGFTYQVIFSLKDEEPADKTLASDSLYSWEGVYVDRPVFALGATTLQVQPVSDEAASTILASGSKYLPDHDFAGGVAKSYLQVFDSWYADYDRTSLMPQLMTFAYDTVASLTFSGKAHVDVKGAPANTTTYSGAMTALYRNNVAMDVDANRVIENDDFAGNVKNIVIGNDKPMVLYSVRAYDRELTKNEVYQNHFADVASSFKLNLYYFDFLGDAGKAVIYNTFADKRIEQMNKTEAQDLLDAAINELPALYLFNYSELYVQDGLVANLSFDSFTSKDKCEVTQFDNGQGTILANFKQYITNSEEPSTWEYGDGYLKTGLNGTVDMTHLLNGVSDFTVQINMAHNAVSTGDLFFDGIRDAIDTDNNSLSSIKALYVGPLRLTYQFSSTHVNTAIGGIKRGQCHVWTHTDANGDKYNTSAPIWTADDNKTKGSNVTTLDTEGKLLTSPLNVPFDISITKTATATGADVTAYRGTTSVKQAAADYNGAAERNVLYIAPGVNINLYSVRVYNRILTDAEIKQNHFADLATYLKISLALFNSMSDTQKTAVYEKFANVTYEDFTDVAAAKKSLESDIAKIMADENPQKLVSMMLKFNGFQVSTTDNVAIRALYAIDKGIFDMLEGTVAVSIGTVYAPAGKDMTVSIDANGNPTVAADVTLTEVYRDNALTGSLVSTSKSTLRFASPLNVTDYNAEYAFRAYITITNSAGTTNVYYCDTASALFGNTVTATELATYFYNEGYTTGAVKIIYDAANQ